jgi:hypothetical protein
VPLTSLDDYVAAAMLPDMHSTTGVPARA